MQEERWWLWTLGPSGDCEFSRVKRSLCFHYDEHAQRVGYGGLRVEQKWKRNISGTATKRAS